MTFSPLDWDELHRVLEAGTPDPEDARAQGMLFQLCDHGSCSLDGLISAITAHPRNFPERYDDAVILLIMSILVERSINVCVGVSITNFS